jgi:hypothetical protein
MLVVTQLDQESIMDANAIAGRREQWTKGKIVGQKAPVQAEGHLGAAGSPANGRSGHERALFDLGIVCKREAAISSSCESAISAMAISLGSKIRAAV